MEATSRPIEPEDMRPPLDAMLRMAIAEAPPHTIARGDDIDPAELAEEHARRIAGVVGRQRRNALDDARLEEVTQVFGKVSA